MKAWSNGTVAAMQIALFPELTRADLRDFFNASIFELDRKCQSSWTDMTTWDVNDGLAEVVCELASQMSMSIRCSFLSRSHCHSWTVPLIAQMLLEQIPLAGLRPCFGLSLMLHLKNRGKLPVIGWNSLLPIFISQFLIQNLEKFIWKRSSPQRLFIRFFWCNLCLDWFPKEMLLTWPGFVFLVCLPFCVRLLIASTNNFWTNWLVWQRDRWLKGIKLLQVLWK